MKVKVQLLLKTYQSLSQERKKFHLKLSRRKILTFQQDKKKLSLKVPKANGLSMYLSLLKMARKPKLFLKKKSQKKLSTKLLKLGLLSLMLVMIKGKLLSLKINHVLSSKTKKFRLQLSLVKQTNCLKDNLVS